MVLIICFCFSLSFFFYLGDLEALKKQSFTMKEGVDYRVKIHFKVNQNSDKKATGLNYIVSFRHYY